MSSISKFLISKEYIYSLSKRKNILSLLKLNSKLNEVCFSEFYLSNRKEFYPSSKLGNLTNGCSF